jgi:hypothetical protein
VGGLGLGGLGGLGLGGLDLCGLGLCGLDLCVGLDPSPPSVHIALCLLCFLVSFLLHVNQHLLFPTETYDDAIRSTQNSRNHRGDMVNVILRFIG